MPSNHFKKLIFLLDRHVNWSGSGCARELLDPDLITITNIRLVPITRRSRTTVLILVAFSNEFRPDYPTMTTTEGGGLIEKRATLRRESSKRREKGRRREEREPKKERVSERVVVFN